MNNHNLKKFASITIGLILAAVLLFFGFSIIQSRFSKASGAIVESSFVVTEVTDSSFTIGFLADDDSLNPQMEYGPECTDAALSLFALASPPEATTDNKTKYTISATLLDPDKRFFYRVNVAGKLYDNNGTCFEITTKPKGATTTTAAGLTPTVSQIILRPTAAPIATPTVAITPAASITDCSVIQRGIGTIYTAFDYSACQSRNASLTPTAAAN